MKSDKISDNINCKGPSKTVNIFMSVKQYTFSDTLPLKCTDQQFGVQNKGLTQHNSYCATTKINPASKPAMSQNTRTPVVQAVWLVTRMIAD